jgi:hypothetical protein
MARQKGVIKAKGRLGEFVGYVLNGQYVFRRLPSVDKKRFQNDPAYEESRKTSSEFGRVSKAGKLFRELLGPFIGEVAQKQLDNPVNKLLSTIKNNDPSPKGERTVGGGLLLPGAANAFTGLEMNDALRISRVCPAVYSADFSNGSIALDFSTSVSLLKWPLMATYALFSACYLRIDFCSSEGAIQISESVRIQRDIPQPIVALKAGDLSGPGTHLLLLKIVFMEEHGVKDRIVKGGAMVVAAAGSEL